VIDLRQDRTWIPNEPVQILQGSNFHVAVVRDVKDPECRGRVRVQAQSIYDKKGEKTWSWWADVAGFPVGSKLGNGDCGVWWTPQPGELVIMGFLGGDYLQPFIIPFSPWKASKDDKQEMIPAEAKVISDGDVRKGTRIRELKTEAGGTLLWDDNGKQELLALMDWCGSGHFSIVPGKTEDDKEKPKEASKWRKGEVRGTKSVMAQTSMTPGEVIEGGVQVSGEVDLNGQGILRYAEDGKGKVIVFASKQNGDAGPSIILDSENECIILTAGETQLVIDNKKGHIEVTRQLIQEQLLRDVSGFFDACWSKMTSAFGRFTSYKKPIPQSSQTKTEDIYA
jgi:hypothetical protein